jgi:hypothetical protein
MRDRDGPEIGTQWPLPAAAANRHSGSRAPDPLRPGGTMRWLLLLLPYIGLLWLPFYNQTEPQLLGFPFFYWYQFAWVPVTSLLIYVVYLGMRR